MFLMQQRLRNFAVGGTESVRLPELEHNAPVFAVKQENFNSAPIEQPDIVTAQLEQMWNEIRIPVRFGCSDFLKQLLNSSVVVLNDVYLMDCVANLPLFYCLNFSLAQY